jgi:hypothetical protein
MLEMVVRSMLLLTKAKLEEGNTARTLILFMTRRELLLEGCLPIDSETLYNSALTHLSGTDAFLIISHPSLSPSHRHLLLERIESDPPLSPSHRRPLLERINSDPSPSMNPIEPILQRRTPPPFPASSSVILLRTLASTTSESSCPYDYTNAPATNPLPFSPSSLSLRPRPTFIPSADSLSPYASSLARSKVPPIEARSDPAVRSPLPPRLATPALPLHAELAAQVSSPAAEPHSSHRYTDQSSQPLPFTSRPLAPHLSPASLTFPATLPQPQPRIRPSSSVLHAPPRLVSTITSRPASAPTCCTGPPPPIQPPASSPSRQLRPPPFPPPSTNYRLLTPELTPAVEEKRREVQRTFFHQAAYRIVANSLSLFHAIHAFQLPIRSSPFSYLLCPP